MRRPEIILFKSTAQAELHVNVFGPDDAGSSKRYPGIVFLELLNAKDASRTFLVADEALPPGRHSSQYR